MRIWRNQPWFPPHQPQPVRQSVTAIGSSDVLLDVKSDSGFQVLQTTYTWNHTCSGSNRFLIVTIALFSTGSVSTLTYNSVSLTRISSISNSGITTEVWGLINPTIGTNTISVTLSGSLTSVGEASSWVNVNQTTATEGTATGTGSGPSDASVAITSTADRCVPYMALCTNDVAVTANQTPINNKTDSVTGSGADEYSGLITPAGGTTMSFTGIDSLKSWSAVAFFIRPTFAAAPASTYVPYDLQHTPQFQNMMSL